MISQNDAVVIEKGQTPGIDPTGLANSGKTVGDMVGPFQSIVTVELYSWGKKIGLDAI